MGRPRSPQLPREQALAACPEPLPVVRCEPRADGGLLVTVRLARPRWHRWLGVHGEMEHTFGLDSLGREVYEACGDHRDVRALIAQFATRHRVSPAEAELAVTAFLRILVARGLVVMAVPEPQG